MKKLNRILLREIVKSKGQFISAAAVIFAGIALFSAFLTAYMNYKNSIDYYYNQSNFIDYYADAGSVTPQVIKKVKAIDGVKNAIGRISEDVGADVGNEKRVTVRLISLPDDHRPEINDIHIDSGNYFDKDTRESCLVSSKFAAFYKLQKGDTVNTIINRKIYKFTVSGIVDSPEFVYALKSPSEITMSAEYFGIVYIKESMAEEIFGYNNDDNQLLVLFNKVPDTASIIDKIEKLLKPYGFTEGVKRKDQLSSNMVQQDFDQLQALSVMFPILFLSTAAMIIFIMMKRIINNQRTLIGVMKALGYTNKRILMHYTLFSLVISLTGALFGDIAGYFLGIGITKVFVNSLNVPVMNIKFYWGVVLSGLAVGVVFCLAAGFSSARKTLKIHPAEAMRSEVPKAGRRIMLERIKPLWKRLSFSSKMIVRNVFRNRQRTLLTMIGVCFTIVLFMASLFLIDSMNYTLKNIFFGFQKQDYKVSFSKYASYQDAIELESINGVRKSEPYLSVPAELRNGWRKQDTAIIGIDTDNDDYSFTNKSNVHVKIPQDGIFISESVSQKLALDIGDTIEVRFQNGGSGEKKYLKIIDVIKLNSGTECYMNISRLGELMGEGRMANGALLNISNGSDEKVTKELFKMPAISTIENKKNAFTGFGDVLATLYAFVAVMIVFGAVMGFAILFNTTVINIMERRRELASLKVLGYTRMEVEKTILGENLLVGAFGFLPGVLLGRLMCDVLGKGISSDTIRVEVVIYPKIYLISFACVFVFIILAQLANRKGIHGLDIVEVLKDREG